ncbi:unnamed protein product [Callosobruchus maculatus]|uniref:NudC domain-containing protein 1 n=1 Tax=Callosobruchus maculatus TaxID=64391 RepID=A0A653DH94_CALMS|nr:unnamed protein product [Callosobruchus maculatus]
MPPTLIELKPKRTLLDPNFDGYKLSLKEIPIKKKDLQRAVDRVLLNPNQFSVLHAKLIGLHNFLVGDYNEESDSVYFIDDEWKVCKTSLNPLTEELTDPVMLWQVPDKQQRKSGDYNLSMKFVATDLMVLADGRGTLHIINTGNRNNNETFTACFSEEVVGNEEPFVIVDAVIKQCEKSQELHVLLLTIKQESCEQKERFVSALHWITLTKVGSEDWAQMALKQLKSKGLIQYAAFEKTCDALYVVSEDECKFTLNSDNPVKSDQTEANLPKAYQWTQTLEDITVKIHLPDNVTKNKITVVTEPTNLEIKLETNILARGDLYQRVDSNLTTWNIEENVLIITLNKSESGLMWPELIKGDETGEYMLETCIVQEAHEKLSHLCSDNEAAPQTGTTFNSQQIEECDFETDKSGNFERLCGKTNEATHKVNLGSHQVLVTCTLDPNLPAAIGIRHDVDVCIWQPNSVEGNFEITHEGTLLAFGYVQASKQNRKFIACPPDLSYTVICESTRHLFIYRQNRSVTDTELRNRSTGRRVHSVAEQQVVNIPVDEEILGIHATNNVLFLLLEKSIVALKM